MTEEQKKILARTKAITEYLNNMLGFLDGQGLIITDEDLITEGLLEMGKFETLVEICKKRILKHYF